MTIQENKRLVMEAYELFKKGDIPSLLERYRDDAEWIGPDSDIVPFAGTYHGKAGIAQFFQKLGESSQATRFEVRDCIAEGDKVVVIGEASWLVKATGHSYDVPWTHVITLRDGKVASFETIYDPTTAEKAFGADTGAQPAAASKGAQLPH
ncbi:nuclear transport factor 2 family protein [Telluria aromaticivorans]|uniref:Nuclear transport factor 2 family protein n=1 Tax=Telluria aromaticivorans TaxID=2725995 RepID=A0A7Y2K1A3_9BURK|nr:nuclear transport factor 2 family protein [Telluria aromaticivorans]NNG24726.1 nuclear transport factor 2 family protein [Telluria aromaticivorans]